MMLHQISDNLEDQETGSETLTTDVRSDGPTEEALVEADRISAMTHAAEQIRQIADEAKNTTNSYVAVQKTVELKRKVEELGRLAGDCQSSAAG